MPSNEENLEVVLPQEDEEESLINSLTPKQQRFIHLYLTGQYGINKMAQLLELHPNTLHKWLRREDVKQVIAEVQQTTHDMVSTQLKQLTMKAANRLNELLDSPIDGVALQAAKDILDRSGHKSKQEIKVDKTVRTFEEKISELIDETIIDADYELIDEDDGVE